MMIRGFIWNLTLILWKRAIDLQGLDVRGFPWTSIAVILCYHKMQIILEKNKIIAINIILLFLSKINKDFPILSLFLR